MALSLYQLSVPRYLQTLTSVAGFLDKALAAGADPTETVEARLIEDMRPFRFQIISVVHHSLGALEGVRSGVFEPPVDAGAADYADLQALVAEARTRLEAMEAGEIDALEGGDLVFRVAGRDIPFVAEDFLLTFSLPNFYFHAATAYDILRARAAPLGKGDYLGRFKMKR